MCKFNNRLFVFSLYCWLVGLVCVWAKPVHETARNNPEELGVLMALTSLLSVQDVHYDQRQKGDENYRIKLDGFVIGLPQEDSVALLLHTDDVFENLDDENLLAFGKNKPAAAIAPAVQKVISTTASEPNQNLLSASANTMANNNTPPPLVVEIPASKKNLEARQSVGSLLRNKSYVSQFLNLLKKLRKH